jgi:presenilin-like A22 family membrane protease
MKYPLKNLFIILSWTILCGILGLIAAPYVDRRVEPLTIDPLLLAGMVIGLMLVGATMWYFLIKKTKIQIDDVFITLTAFVIADLAAHFGVGSSGNWIDNMLALLAVFLIVMSFYAYIVKQMQASWEGTKRYMWASNLFNVLFISAAACLIGSMAPPIAAVLIFAGAAVYDAVAVWKLGTMQVMAHAFLDKRIIPGVGFAKEEEGKFGILGGGDLFFLVFVPVAFFKSSPVMMFWLMGAEFVGLLALFAMSRKEKSYPALPYMFAPIVVVLMTLFVMTR